MLALVKERQQRWMMVMMLILWMLPFCGISGHNPEALQEKIQRRATVWEWDSGVSLLEIAEENIIGRNVFTKNVARLNLKTFARVCKHIPHLKISVLPTSPQ